MLLGEVGLDKQESTERVNQDHAGQDLLSDNTGPAAGAGCRACRSARSEQRAVPSRRASVPFRSAERCRGCREFPEPGASRGGFRQSAWQRAPAWADRSGMRRSSGTEKHERTVRRRRPTPVADCLRPKRCRRRRQRQTRTDTTRTHLENHDVWAFARFSGGEKKNRVVKKRRGARRNAL